MPSRSVSASWLNIAITTSNQQKAAKRFDINFPNVALSCKVLGTGEDGVGKDGVVNKGGAGGNMGTGIRMGMSWY